MNLYTKQDLINFEKKIYDLFEDGQLPYLVHLCGGNEDHLIDIFNEINEEDWVFSSHRTHYHYLLKGGSEEKLLSLIKEGNSMFVFDKSLNFFSSSILAGTACIAAGVAYSLKTAGSTAKVYCFLGDGAEDEGHIYEAVRFVDGHELPCKFIIEDNDRSVDTSKEQRRGKSRFTWPDCVVTYKYNPVFPHASTGSGKIVKFSPEIVKDYLERNEI